MRSQKKSLILAAHHDDAEFGCGGLIARYAKTEAFHIAVFFTGGYERDGKTIFPETRTAETQKALRTLGLEPALDLTVCRKFGENTAASGRLDCLADEITALVKQTKPTDLYLPLKGYNQDHEALHKAGLIAMRPGYEQLDPLPRLWLYEYPGDVWGLGAPPPRYGARHTVLTKEQADLKVAALICHASQFRGRYTGAVGEEGANMLMKLRGGHTLYDAAETHYLMQEIVA